MNLINGRKNTGQKWPTYKNENGQTINYDMHHIVEKQYGGSHSWWNMHPARGGSNTNSLNKHQSGIHKTDSSKKLFPDK